MPTTITKSIGSAVGRDYPTLAAWIADCPADLIVADEIWKGECYNDSEFLSSAGVLLNMPAITADATRYVWLTAAAGQSFQDNGSVRTNKLDYNQANGVALRVDTTYASNVITNTSISFRLERLQLKCDTLGAPLGAGSVLVNVKDCLMHCTHKQLAIHQASTGSTVTNCSIYLEGTDTFANAVINGFYGMTVLGCTIVRNSANSAIATAIDGSSGMLVESCAIFGFTTPIAHAHASCSNNATDAASCSGSSNQTSVTFNATTPFTQAGSTNTDLKAIASTALAGNGLFDGTNAPLDISLLSRASPPTIGAWELAAAGGGGSASKLSLLGAGAS